MSEEEKNIQEDKSVIPEGKYAVAEEEFARFAESWNIDTELDYMPEEDQDSFLPLKRRIIRALHLGANPSDQGPHPGSAIVNVDGDIEYKLKQKIGDLVAVTIRRPSGHSIYEMDKVKIASKTIAKTNKIYADAMGIPSSYLASSKMDGIDYKFIQGVYLLFFAS